MQRITPAPNAKNLRIRTQHLTGPICESRWGSISNVKKFNEPLKHDDIVIVPELFGPESNWDIYYKLVSEMGECKRHPTHMISEDNKGLK